MKKLLKLALLVGLFFTFSSNQMNAQTITNNTDCPFRVTVGYTLITCFDGGFETFNVPANSVVTMSGKASVARGAAVQLTLGPCLFEIGDALCTSFPLSDTVNCGVGAICATYTATLDDTTGSIVIE